MLVKSLLIAREPWPPGGAHPSCLRCGFVGQRTCHLFCSFSSSRSHFFFPLRSHFIYNYRMLELGWTPIKIYWRLTLKCFTCSNTWHSQLPYEVAGCFCPHFSDVAQRKWLVSECPCWGVELRQGLRCPTLTPGSCPQFTMRKPRLQDGKGLTQRHINRPVVRPLNPKHSRSLSIYFPAQIGYCPTIVLGKENKLHVKLFSDSSLVAQPKFHFIY